jgi:hypothetical protein
MTYLAGLPSMFPYYIEDTPEDIQALATILILPRQSAPNGSSFAITSDAPRGKRRLWLSEASLKTLTGMRAIPNLYEARKAGTGE